MPPRRPPPPPRIAGCRATGRLRGSAPRTPGCLRLTPPPEPRRVALDDDPPQDAAFAAIVIAVRPVHRGAIVDDEYVALAPFVHVDDFRLDHALDQIAQIGAARLRAHALDVERLGDVEEDRARPVDRMGADHRMDDRGLLYCSQSSGRVSV